MRVAICLSHQNQIYREISMRYSDWTKLTFLMLNHSFKENLDFTLCVSSLNRIDLSLAGPNILSTKIGGGLHDFWKQKTRFHVNIMGVFVLLCPVFLKNYDGFLWFMNDYFRMICRISHIDIIYRNIGKQILYQRK